MATKQEKATKKAKRGLFILLTGFVVILIGAGLITAGTTSSIITGWVLEVIGIFIGLYGYGYFIGTITPTGTK